MKRFLLTIAELILSIVMLINVILLLTIHTASIYATVAQCGLMTCVGAIALVNFVKEDIRKSRKNKKELDSLFEEISNEFTVEEIKNIFA